MDVLSAGGNKITWHENTDGRGTFSDQQIITTQANGARSVDAADLDGDGDLDVLSASSRDGKVAWHEQRLVGDVNDDGAFNSADLVLVLQTGEYEDNIPRNSTFDEGDWNQDGDFDSGDLVLAFQAGHYEAAATPPANQIAAAVDWLFAQNQRASGSRAYVA